jgi:phage shock protein E
MMNFFKSIFSGPDTAMLKQVIADGAIVIDVRTPGEFASGHPKGAKNIPLDTLPGKIDQIKGWKKPVVVCCASGMRSARAKSLLTSKEIEVHDAGPWTTIA